MCLSHEWFGLIDKVILFIARVKYILWLCVPMENLSGVAQYTLRNSLRPSAVKTAKL